MNHTKKKILFVMNNLRCGGAEKALVSLLQTFDYSLYEVDLLLLKKEGLFLNQVPAEVTILPSPFGYSFFDMSFVTAILQCLKIGRFDIIFRRIKMVFLFKAETNAVVREQKLWRYLGSILPKLSGSYDTAIGFLEKTPNYYCVDKVDAITKIGFIHNDYEELKLDVSLDLPYFDRFDYIATVSERCLHSLQRSFPNHLNKLLIIGNITSPKLVLQLAEAPVEPLFNGLKLMTMGRLSPQKGYDMLVHSAKILKDSQLDFKWYILGVGELQAEIEELIVANQLEENIIFLGLKENPYPYIFQSDIYVQPSRFEGKSVAIDEAKILCKPIIVTDFSTAADQIQNGENGLIVSMNPESISKGIIRMVNDVDFQHKIKINLLAEMKGNENEIEKLYQLINV